MPIEELYLNNATVPQETEITFKDADGDIATAKLESGRGQIAYEGWQKNYGSPGFVFSTDRDMSGLYKALQAYAADQLAFRHLRAWGDAQVNTIPNVRAGEVRFYGLQGIGAVQYEVIT